MIEKISGIENSAEKYGEGRVFVEIGFGWDPAILGAGVNPVRREYFSNTHYVGVDLDGGQVHLAKDATSLHETEHMKSIGFNEGKITDLDLPPKSVDEVYVSNVFAQTNAEQDALTFSAQSMYMQDRLRGEKDPVKRREIIQAMYPALDGDPRRPFSAVLASLETVKQALKPEGKMTVVETNTPVELEMLQVLLEDLGFEIVEVITPEDEIGWRRMEERYHMQEPNLFYSDDVPYLLTAKLKPPEPSLSTEWRRDTILAPERGVMDYVGGLGLFLDDFDGKVLDLGSGSEQRLNEEVGMILQANPGLDIHPDIVSLSPDMINSTYREQLRQSPGFENKTVAALAEHLPFESESFDRVLGLGSVVIYAGFEGEGSDGMERVQAWLEEVVRVLKPGGEARLGMLYGEGDHQKYIDAFNSLSLDANIKIEQALDTDGEPFYTTSIPQQYVYRLVITKHSTQEA